METGIIKSERVCDTALDLLSEVDAICEDNGIEYFLSPDMVKRAVDHLDYETYFVMPSIYMTLENALQFIEVIEKNPREGRSLEYLGNSNNYASFNVSYVNTNTTFVEISRGEDFSQFGLKVVIHIIRNDIGNRIPAFIETGRESNSFKAKKKRNWKQRTVEYLVAKGMKSKGETFGEELFNYYIERYKKNPDSPKVFVRRFKKKRLYYDRAIFSDRQKIEMEGRMFYAPKDIDGYLSTFYKRYLEVEEMKEFVWKGKLISNTVPFDVYLRRLDQLNLPIETVFKQQKVVKEDKILNTKILRAVENVYRIAQMSYERMLIYQDLHGKIDQLRTLYAYGDFEALGEEFNEYDERARYYLKNDLALCPDEELFEMECALMEYRGDFKKAKIMRKLVANHHKKPLVGRTANAAEQEE